jgi:hypothetical protein
MSNPFLDIQERVAALLAPHFAGETILTESLGDLPQRIERLVLELGFGLVVTTAKGRASDDGTANTRATGPLHFREELTVAIIHNPLLRPGPSVLDALWTACAALHGQAATGGARAPVLKVTGHEARDDAPDGLVVHHLHLELTHWVPGSPGTPVPPPPPAPESAFALKAPTNGAYRIKTDGTGSYWQVKNTTTGLWHTVFAVGGTGGEYLTIGPAEA